MFGKFDGEIFLFITTMKAAFPSLQAVALVGGCMIFLLPLIIPALIIWLITEIFKDVKEEAKKEVKVFVRDQYANHRGKISEAGEYLKDQYSKYREKIPN